MTGMSVFYQDSFFKMGLSFYLFCLVFNGQGHLQMTRLVLLVAMWTQVSAKI